MATGHPEDGNFSCFDIFQGAEKVLRGGKVKDNIGP